MAANLLGEAHEKHFGLANGPVVLKVLFGLGPDAVFGGLQCLQQLGQLCSDFLR